MLVCTSCGEENPDRARFCLACAAPLTAAAPERRKLATLLFCDVSGSTAMGERVDAESVRDLMFRYFHEMRSAIERHGGTVEKFVGDAVMAVFGVPTAHEDDALRAVRAAAEMRDRLGDLNRELEQRFGVTLALRIGVNTGQVVAGDVSTRETLVTGDAVNVAARLEQAAGQDEILLGETTVRLTRHAVAVEAVDPLPLKGKADPVRAYRLLEVEAAPPAGRRFDAALVGRAAELARLGRLFAETAQERRCRLVTVVGEPGVGKSRLLAELVALVEGRATVVRGRCLSYGEGITYWPLVEIVRDAAGLHDEDAGKRGRLRIEALMADDPEGPAAATHLAAAAGVVDTLTSPEEVAWATRRLLATLARVRPVLALVEDVHWAEPALLDLLETLPRLDDAAVLVVATARPELLEQRPDVVPHITLAPLPKDDAGRLVEGLLGATGLPEALHERIAAASGGNPLFVEELVAMLIDDGLLRPRNGGWSATAELATLTIPPSISGLLADRLDRLPQPERTAAERGAVEGLMFHRGAVVELSEGEASREVGSALAELARRDVINPAVAVFAGDAAFRFRHVLIRDAAYAGMPKKLRARLHERFADWLDRTAGIRAGEYEEILGYHLEQAYRHAGELGPLDDHAREVGRRAAVKLAAAGRRATARGDAPAAVNLLGRAIELVPDDDRLRVEVLPELAEAAADAGDVERALALADEAVEAARVLADPAIEARAAVPRLVLRMMVDETTQLDEVRETLDAAVATLTAAGDDQGLARAWRAAAWIDLMAAQGAPMRRAIERAVAHARAAGDRREEAEALFLLPMLLYFGPTPCAEAVPRCEQLLAEAGPAGKVEALALAALAGLRALDGRLDEARELARASAAKLNELGLTIYGSSAAEVIAEVELLAGNADAAERALRPSVEELDRLGEKGFFSTMSALLAESLYRQGRNDEAVALTERSEEATHAGDLVSQSLWRRVRGKALARLGRLDEAERLAREAVEFIERSDCLMWIGDARADQAEVLDLAGRREEARAALEAALAAYERKGARVPIARMHDRLARLATLTA